VLSKLKGRFRWLSLIWVRIRRSGYAGRLLDWAAEFGNPIRDGLRHWLLQIVTRSADMQGFEVLPRRCVVERTLSWLGRYRRLSKDNESLTASSEVMILLARSNLMPSESGPDGIHRLKPG
jgi:transposase